MLAKVCGTVEGAIVINSGVLRKKQAKAKTFCYFSAYFLVFGVRIFFPPHSFNLYKVTGSSFVSLAYASASMLLSLFGAKCGFTVVLWLSPLFRATVVQLQSIFGARGDPLGSSLQKQIRTWWDIQL